MNINLRIRALVLSAVIGSAATGCFWYAPPRNGVVYVSLRPPVERVEVIPAAPGMGFVWVRGWWAYRGTEYAWMPGRWERPLEGRHEWVPARWVHDRHGWYLVDGRWR